VLESIDPLSLINFAIGPSIRTHAFGLAIYETPIVIGTAGVFFITFSVFGISLPLSLIDPPIIINHDALALPLRVHDLAVVNALSVFFQADVIG
jgi:hypothetical protein